jgi:putative flavoprotein involved in K+ transport
MAKKIDTIIVGGGQGGLSTSYCLTQHGIEHLVLEQADQPAHAWRNGRWDSFTLVTPNWSFRLPGAPYQGDDPHGYMGRDEIVRTFEAYVERFNLPVQFQTRVRAVEPKGGSGGFEVRTADETFQASNVVIASGLYQRPRLPAYSRQIAGHITQLHTSQYRNPGALPPGAVLVAGSGQSGCQIAEELYQSGRKVYLCVGSAASAPRRYRGKDIYEWLHLNGFLDRTEEQLPSPKARFASNPTLTGRDGGHSLNLHQFARDGVVLLGKIAGAQDETIHLAPDLHENLAKADQAEDNITKMIDGYIESNNLDAPPESLPVLRDGFDCEQAMQLNLQAEGINTLIWAMGYAFDFSLVKFPSIDRDGFPIQKGGVSEVPGLYFAGLPWMPGQKSGLLLGVAENAEHIAATIAAR